MRVIKLLAKNKVLITVLMGAFFIGGSTSALLNNALSQETPGSRPESGYPSTTRANSNEKTTSQDDSKVVLNSNSGTRDYSEAYYYLQEAEKASVKAAELRRCSAVNLAAYNSFKYDKSDANHKLFDIQQPALLKDLDDGKISLPEYDMQMKLYYGQYNNTVSALFNTYTNSVEGKGCVPDITTPPTPLAWNY